MVGFSLVSQTTHNNGVSVGTGLYLPFYPISESYNQNNWFYVDEYGNISEGEDIAFYGRDAKIYLWKK
jgi:hypothetical protein